jgi:small GTP-binding protein
MEKIIQKKICLLGDFSTGKSSLSRRFVYNIFEERYLSTLGVNISRKIIDIPEHSSQIRLLIWDLSGNEKFDGARSDYLRGSSGALLVCDLTRTETVNRMIFFSEYFQSIRPDSPIVIIGNKSDLVDSNCPTIELVNDIASRLGCMSLITSAKTGEGVEYAFHTLSNLILDHHEK